MSDFYLFLGGALTILVIAIVIAIIESIGKCHHVWDDWKFREDSACFIQSRKCVKCQYMELQQTRKVSNETEQL